jgi:hypothetical protein
MKGTRDTQRGSDLSRTPSQSRVKPADDDPKKSEEAAGTVEQREYVGVVAGGFEDPIETDVL